MLSIAWHETSLLVHGLRCSHLIVQLPQILHDPRMVPPLQAVTLRYKSEPDQLPRHVSILRQPSSARGSSHSHASVERSQAEHTARALWRLGPVLHSLIACPFMAAFQDRQDAR